ncbi:hypothetical protein D3C71_892100 [compost metagenome]
MISIDEIAVVGGRLRRQTEQRQDRGRQVDGVGIGQTAQQGRNLTSRDRALKHRQQTAGDGTAVCDRAGVARGLVVAGVTNPARELEPVRGLEGQVGEQVIRGQFGAVDRDLDMRRLQIARDRRGQGPCPHRRQGRLQELRRHGRIGRDRQGVVAHRRRRTVQQSGQLGQGDALVELGRGALITLFAEPAGAGKARQAPAVVPVQAELLAPLFAVSFLRRRQQRQRQTIGVEGLVGIELAIGRGRVQRQRRRQRPLHQTRHAPDLAVQTQALAAVEGGARRQGRDLPRRTTAQNRARRRVGGIIGDGLERGAGRGVSLIVGDQVGAQIVRRRPGAGQAEGLGLDAVVILAAQQVLD